MADPATTRLANSVGYVYKDSDSYTKFEDEEGRDMVTDAYSTSQTYDKGALCIYDNKLYKATSAISTAEVWTPGHWSQTDINTELGAVNGTIGSTDISGIGDGSITGALSSLNADRKTYAVKTHIGSSQTIKTTEYLFPNSLTIPSDGVYLVGGSGVVSNYQSVRCKVSCGAYNQTKNSAPVGFLISVEAYGSNGQSVAYCKVDSIITASKNDVVGLRYKGETKEMTYDYSYIYYIKLC